ncbi:MAG: PIG-L family deacetylase [Clostridiales bacterium]|nr:PIG-L family deacetylase [Clostridiales bacterium]
MRGFLKEILAGPAKLFNKTVLSLYLITAKGRIKGLKPLQLPGGKALILAPHQDDEILGCGCFILKMIKEGGKVKTVFFTDGSKSTEEIEPETLKRIRKTEAQKVAKTLGMESPEFLDREDGELDHRDVGAAMKLIKIVKNFQPDLIMVPYFLDGHKDHSAVSGIFINALESINFKGRLFAYKTNSPISIHGVTHFIDCTDFMEYKKNALNLYESQSMSFESILLMDKLNGIIANAEEGAELFRELNLNAYKKAYRKYNKDNNIWKSFKQMYSIYFMVIAYFKGIKLKKEIADYQNIKSRKPKEMEL